MLLVIDQPQANHNGGWLAFGPHDGLLYIGSGDGGGGGDDDDGHTLETGNAQDTSDNLLGKILRIDVDGTNGSTGNYGIPTGNPFVEQSRRRRDLVLRAAQPVAQRFRFAQTGDLYIADVGQRLWEEVRLPARFELGRARTGAGAAARGRTTSTR